MALKPIPPPLEGEPKEIEASTIKEAVAIATEHVEANEPVTVVATENIEDKEPSWVNRRMEALTKLVEKLQNSNEELRAILTRQEDQLKLVISSKPLPPQESSETSLSATPQELPIEPPPTSTLKPESDVPEDLPEVQTKPRKRRKI